jgi:LPXTG-motif cell wall-anchored protein
MSITTTPGTDPGTNVASPVSGGANAPTPHPSFVTTTSICLGNEATGLCAQFATTTVVATTGAPTTTEAISTTAPPLPVTGSEMQHDLTWAGSGFVLLGIATIALSRRGRRWN